ncbi:MAG: LuxR C-terminal-related transcriptional regulator [Bacteroidales bacterium]|nr:LuxR C-terminal-related transcriptional regulator [Bacteroidales bacterium]
MLSTRFSPNDRMCDIISQEFHLLQMMCRFGIPLGVGEKTVSEVCEAAGVHTPTFLAVANFMRTGMADSIKDVSVKALVDYLSGSHDYFLNFQLPTIRRKLLEAIDCSGQDHVALLILKFFDEYMGDVRGHMTFEDKKVFTYVRGLLSGVRPDNYSICRFSKSHVGVDKKLQELKNIIIKYYRPQATGTDELMNMLLFDIVSCENDLRKHCELEDALFVPVVEQLETEVEQQPATSPGKAEESGKADAEALSEREKEIVHYAVCGLTNKEIAARLYISFNTVLTHRKNISRKLDIHSLAGLTIYAIANGIVNIDEVKK